MHSNLILEHLEEGCTCCWVPEAKSGSCVLDTRDLSCLCMSADTRFRANHGDEHGIENRKICDFIFFCVRGPDQVVIPCEMKGANPDIRHVQKQLQTGAQIAEIVLDTFPTPRFIALLASRKMLKPESRKLLGRVKIAFRGGEYPVRWTQCGSNLKSVI